MCSLLSLVSFIEWNVLEVHPCLIIFLLSISFHHGILFHCMDMLHLLPMHQLMDIWIASSLRLLKENCYKCSQTGLYVDICWSAFFLSFSFSPKLLLTIFTVHTHSNRVPVVALWTLLLISQLLGYCEVCGNLCLLVMLKAWFYVLFSLCSLLNLQFWGVMCGKAHIPAVSIILQTWKLPSAAFLELQ